MAGSVGKQGVQHFKNIIWFWIFSITPAISSSFCFIRQINKTFFWNDTHYWFRIIFISSLALFDLAFLSKGGKVGSLLHQPLVKLFDVYATAIILGALVFISILVIFDEAFNVSSLLNIFKRKEKEETEKEVKILDGNEPAKGYQEKPIQVSPVKQNIIQPDGGRGFQNS